MKLNDNFKVSNDYDKLLELLRQGQEVLIRISLIVNPHEPIKNYFHLIRKEKNKDIIITLENMHNDFAIKFPSTIKDLKKFCTEYKVVYFDSFDLNEYFSKEVEKYGYKLEEDDKGKKYLVSK
jgi:hypothetical protein